MADLVLQRGAYSDYFVVSLDGAPYAIPERGADLAVRLRGRVPSRYAPGGINADFGQGADEEGVVVVERFVPWEDQVGPGGVLQFEGLVRHAGEALHAKGALAFDSLRMPVGIDAVLGYEGLSPERRRELADMPSPPVGTLRLW